MIVTTETAIPTPTPNVKLFDQLLEWIEDEDAKADRGEPTEWDQETWFDDHGCGTVCCIAGKAALLSGYVPVMTEENTLDGLYVIRKDADSSDDWERVADVAQDVLGLTYEQRHFLFMGHNDLDNIRQIVAKIKAGDLMLRMSW